MLLKILYSTDVPLWERPPPSRSAPALVELLALGVAWARLLFSQTSALLSSGGTNESFFTFVKAFTNRYLASQRAPWMKSVTFDFLLLAWTGRAS